MKTPLKVLLGFFVVVVLVLVGGYFLVQNQSGTIAQQTVTSMTGNEQLGELASKVMSGEDLSDSEIENATGLDDSSYQKVKSAAAEAGIDLNDSEQLKGIALKNADKAGQVKTLVEQVQSGELTEEEAAKQLESMIER